jgi:beta-lactamase class A
MSLTTDLVQEIGGAAGLGNLSFVLKRLDRPGEAATAVEPERALYPASMLKTPLAVAAYTLVQEGELRLDAAYEVTQANMTANDKPSPLVPGYRSPLAELIELMITISDNVATNMLYDIIGRERATQIVQERYGLRGTAFYRKLSGSEPLIHDPDWDRIHRNTHPAADAAKLFEAIARDEVPFALALRETLMRQQFNERLPEGFEPGDRFAHKTGSTDDVSHDGGILYTREGASYAIVVYTGLESTEEHDGRFGPFMRSLRAYL